jgi:thiosulfate reductase cytochrome b subunit
VANGAVYAGHGVWRDHFRDAFLAASNYGLLQKITYVLVVFFLFPLMIATGLAMSPAIGAVLPILVRTLGGYQSARTLHFVVTLLLVGFVLIHVLMVYLTGFKESMYGMLTGRQLRDET